MTDQDFTEQEQKTDGPKTCFEQMHQELSSIQENSKKMAADMREMHRLYHNEFAGRLKSMQEELEKYHEIDRGRVFDDLLYEVARIYCDNEQMIHDVSDEKLKKRIQYLFQDIEQLLELKGVFRLNSNPGDKRNNRFTQIVDRIETDDPELHDTVARSRGTGFYTEKRPLIKELIDIYVYKEA